MATPYPYLSPVIDVTLAGRAIGLLTARLGVTSDLCGKADTCVLMVADGKGELGRALRRGDPLIVRWGYAGGDLSEIFRGVVRRPGPAKAGVGLSDPLVIRGIDYNTILNHKRIRVTFENETAGGVIRAVMADTGLGLAIEECELEIDRLPFFNRKVRECVDAVTDLVRREIGDEYFNYIREGVFHWGRKDSTQSPVRSFRTGVDIIRMEQLGDGLTFMETLVVPVHHSEVITIDGERFLVVKVEYLWQDGGRTMLWCESC